MVLVDKSKATRSYADEYEMKTGKPYQTPFPKGSIFNNAVIERAKQKHELYLAKSLEEKI